MIDRDRENCLELLGPRVPNELNRPVYVARRLLHKTLDYGMIYI